MTGDGKRHVTIVGAGIVGVCCAGWLQRKGHQVTLVDRAGPGEGTSFGNAGLLSPSAFLPVAMPGMLAQVPGWLLDPLGPLTVRWRYLPQVLPWLVSFLRHGNRDEVRQAAAALRGLLQPLFECYEPLVRNAGVADLIRRTGCLYVYDTEESFRDDEPSLQLRRSLGATLETIGESEIRQLEPALSRRFRWGVFAADNGMTLDPHRLTVSLAEQVVRDGGQVLRREVRDIAVGSDGRRRLVTDQGELPVDVLVIAAGAWSHRLTARLGDPVPLETQRGYHVTLADPGVSLGRMVTWGRRRVFTAPMAMGLRLAGTVELAGLAAPPDYRRADVLLTIGRDMFPDLKTDRVSRWMGHRPCLPDSLPVIGPASRHPDVWYAFGHQHIGMCGAPATGRTIAELISGETPQVDIQPFRVGRF